MGGSLNKRVEDLEDQLQPGVVVQLLGFPTEEEGARYVADLDRPRSEGVVLLRLYPGVDIEAV